jgi:hypothetical protein
VEQITAHKWRAVEMEVMELQHHQGLVVIGLVVAVVEQVDILVVVAAPLVSLVAVAAEAAVVNIMTVLVAAMVLAVEVVV